MLKDTPRSRMWESCLSGSERGLGTTMARLLESLSYSKVTQQWLPIEEEPGMAGQTSLGKV